MLDRGRGHILDTIGLALAGARSEAAGIARAHVESLHFSSGVASVLGTDLRTAPRFAAFLNAAAMHADNFDDTNPQASPSRNGGIHATAAVLPAALALAEAKGASGRDLTTAVHAGIEVSCKLNHAIGARHYESGFHSTATLNAFGTVVAAARMLGLGATPTEHALAFAASGASGVRRNFGSMVEILHPGMAAETGIVGADLAARGLTGAADAIAGAVGFFEAAGDGFEAEVLDGRLGNPWVFLDPGMSIKPFPSGALTHPAVTRLLEVVRDRDIAADDVASLTVRTNRRVLETLIHHAPTTALQAKFSMEFSLAVVLVERRAGLAQFTDATVVRPDVRAVMERIRYEAYDRTEPDYTNVTTFLSIALRDGREIEERVDYAIGSAQVPMSFEQIAQKFRGCAEFADWPRDRTEVLIDIVGGLETLDDVRLLTRLASRSGG